MDTNENGNIPTRELRKVQTSLFQTKSAFKEKLLDNMFYIPEELIQICNL